MEILELKLFTSRCADQKRFYTKTLDFPLLREDSRSFSLRIGRSTLTFVEEKHATPYHFAFTIPSNQEEQALAWVRKRADILRHDGEEMVDFPNWNAKSIYFYDRDKNIVELVARKNLPFDSEHPFDGQNLVEISEIGMPVSSIEAMYQDLHKKLSLEIFDGNFDAFCAVGSERGLCIVIDKNKKKWFPTNDKPFSSPFTIKIKEKDTTGIFRFEKGGIYVDI